MERHLANVSPPFGIHDQIGLRCIPFSDQFAEVGDSPRRQLQTLQMSLSQCSTVLSSCTYALAHRRYTRRHNQVLQIMLEAAKTACSQTNARETAPASRIYFLREGSSQHCKKKNENQRRDLLSKAKDWEVAADLQGERHCHKMLQESGKRTLARLSVVVNSEGLLHTG